MKIIYIYIHMYIYIIYIYIHISIYILFDSRRLSRCLENLSYELTFSCSVWWGSQQPKDFNAENCAERCWASFISSSVSWKLNTSASSASTQSQWNCNNSKQMSHDDPSECLLAFIKHANILLEHPVGTSRLSTCMSLGPSEQEARTVLNTKRQAKNDCHNLPHIDTYCHSRLRAVLRSKYAVHVSHLMLSWAGLKCDDVAMLEDPLQRNLRDSKFIKVLQVPRHWDLVTLEYSRNFWNIWNWRKEVEEGDTISHTSKFQKQCKRAAW